VTVKGGQQSTVAVKLNQAGKRLLAKHKRFTAMLSISSHGVVIKSQKVALKLKK
jgi:hypothetical protein